MLYRCNYLKCNLGENSVSVNFGCKFCIISSNIIHNENKALWEPWIIQPQHLILQSKIDNGGWLCIELDLFQIHLNLGDKASHFQNI